jgi:ArsR family transcriptional regulator, arsenate/arsenite/antimonite-responsive transcriptional repressor
MKLEVAAGQLEALGNPTRLQIYRLLVGAGPDGLSAGAIQGRLQMAASTLSHHVRRQVEARRVTQERQGTSLTFRAHYPSMEALGFLASECCAEAGCAPRSRPRRLRETA